MCRAKTALGVGLRLTEETVENVERNSEKQIKKPCPSKRAGDVGDSLYLCPFAFSVALSAELSCASSVGV